MKSPFQEQRDSLRLLNVFKNRCHYVEMQQVYTYRTPAFFFFFSSDVRSVLWSGMDNVCCTYCGPHYVLFLLFLTVVFV